jgi:hypothetical protein
LSLKVDKDKVSTVFALTLLIVTLLYVNVDPLARAEESDLYLHGPSLVPIHMHGPALVPIHMHSKIGIIDLYEPMWTPWHELHPEYCQSWTFTSWEDNGNDFLDSSDQIDMTNYDTNETRWYHVDRVTMTMRLYSEYYNETIYVEYKGPYDPYIQPVCTNWTEVWPVYLGVTGGPYHICVWNDNGNGYLDFCDFIGFTQFPEVWWHVEEYSTDLILNEKIMDPIGIWWHELYPTYCNWHELTSWEEHVEDPYPGRLSPGDQIDMMNETSGITKWYFVDRVTLTLYITINATGEAYYFEFKGSFEEMYDVKTEPVCTYWHMVWPYYEYLPPEFPGYHITEWIDNCNGVLDYCDYILLEGVWCHVEEVSIDIILNEKIDDPTCTFWHELYPECCVNDYHIVGWKDNASAPNGLLSPCDTVTMQLMPDGANETYHVEEVTLTLNLSVQDSMGSPFEAGQRIYIESIYGYEWMYYVKIDPEWSDWEVVCPTDWFGYPLTMTWWGDTCNGVLSYCDFIELMDPYEGWLSCHVDDVAVDMVVRKIIVEPVHDVAVTEVFSIYDWVYEGDIDPIKVTVENQGDYTETVDVTAYYDGTPAAPMKTISLNSGDVQILTFNWDTTGVPPGSYTVSATATIPVDDDPSDNSMVGNTERIKELPWYIKPPYPDYAPSGMPDFDERQWGTYNWTDMWGAWSHCGPVACANSIFWYDSEYEYYTNPSSPPPPTISDSFPLVVSYGIWDDHALQNIPPLIEHLAWLMDCDARRTGPATGSFWSGTYVNDMEAGLAHYLSWSGVNPQGDVNGDGTVDLADLAIVSAANGSIAGGPGWNLAADIWPATTTYPPWTDNIIDNNDINLVNANLGKTGIFYEHTAHAWKDDGFFWYIEEEVERCQDVVLLLGFYWVGTEYREGGHYITVAGINSTTQELLISNPIRDDFEAGKTPGRSPVPHIHLPPEPPYTTHNNASLVSHDAYNVTFIPSPSGYYWVLDGYFPPETELEARIEYAVVTSPLEPVELPDIAVTNLTICFGQTACAQNRIHHINVTVTNEGPTDENFTLTVHWNDTNVIASKSVSLLSGNTKIVPFTWNANQTRYLHYTLSAYATPVPGESDTADNKFTDDTVIIVMSGDVDADGDVDIYDVVKLCACYGTKVGDSHYDPNCDIDCDGDVDIYDVVILCANYGYEEP